MGRTCNTYRQVDKCVETLAKNLKGRDHLNGLGVDERVMLKWTLQKQSLGLGHLNVSWVEGKIGSYRNSGLDWIRVVQVG